LEKDEYYIEASLTRFVFTNIYICKGCKRVSLLIPLIKSVALRWISSFFKEDFFVCFCLEFIDFSFVIYFVIQLFENIWIILMSFDY